MSRKLLLVANPGSSSRKYALYTHENNKVLDCVAQVHFEADQHGTVVYSITANGKTLVDEQEAGISHVTFSLVKLPELLEKHGLIGGEEAVSKIGLRIVAPSSFFQKNHTINTEVISELKKIKHHSTLHVGTVLQEIVLLQKQFPGVRIFGASDSAFHADMPDFARTYAIPQTDAKKADVWRFGFHGLSMASVVRQLSIKGTLPQRVIACHLGSGCSVTALHEGKSIETSMGYSPTEGLVMATRSGNIDLAAGNDLASELNLNRDQLEEYLSHKSGLLGLSGTTSDIRQLLELEKNGDKSAKLALQSFVYHVQLAIGQMAAALGGCDVLVLTGTVGERSSTIRSRVVSKLDYLGISPKGTDVPVVVLATDEAYEIAQAAVND